MSLSHIILNILWEQCIAYTIMLQKTAGKITNTVEFGYFEVMG